MIESALAEHFGYPEGGLAERCPGPVVLDHAWWDPATFDADLTVIVGPVFP
ncbi:protein of unknown function [Modestobacter italicus]|uniref:Uncharacterized protein n=1 Tax=Modestobacter italicus (strain DSM 44449 / CECT 9708 / BC 501) TaxID=2732864 RepID=I4EYK7_MODI5|nr:hypothetical protein [Modestobacter marinus]CCH88470.1 protein of unknown function [Modestobacter marinus]